MFNAKVTISGRVESVTVNAAQVVYFYRDADSGHVHLRLIDGSDVVSDLRIAKITELVAGAAAK